MVKILEKVLERLRTHKEETELIHKVDILKWENELKPAAIELSEKLNISYEEALTYLKSIDNKKGSGDFKEKLQNLMDGMKAASETINAAMGVNEPTEMQTPATDKPLRKKKTKQKQGGRTKSRKEEDEFGLETEEPEIYIPEIYIPKLPKM